MTRRYLNICVTAPFTVGNSEIHTLRGSSLFSNCLKFHVDGTS